MPLPAPVPGLSSAIAICGTASTWRARGRRERSSLRDRGGLRPADDAGETRVLVLPVTHSPPAQAALAVEIPAQVKERLRLDAERSWVVPSEWNEFIWPGPDLRLAPGGDDNSVAYGMLPPRLFATIRDRFLALAMARRARRVPRTE